MRRKIVALIHWWMQLEPIRHRHWCEIDAKGCGTRCEHEGSAWMCEGIFCVNQNRKNCPGCASGKPCPPVPLNKRYYGYRCACGLGMLLATLLLCGCLNRAQRVQRYQQKATAECLKKHTVEECRPLPFPACDENGCHQ